LAGVAVRPGALALAAGLVLAACGHDPGVMVSPQLRCDRAVKCHVYEWQLGVRYGPQLSGTHINCRCLEAPA
jgi:hypothetical protein